MEKKLKGAFTVLSKTVFSVCFLKETCVHQLSKSTSYAKHRLTSGLRYLIRSDRTFLYGGQSFNASARWFSIRRYAWHRDHNFLKQRYQSLQS